MTNGATVLSLLACSTNEAVPIQWWFASTSNMRHEVAGRASGAARLEFAAGMTHSRVQRYMHRA